MTESIQPISKESVSQNAFSELINPKFGRVKQSYYTVLLAIGTTFYDSIKKKEAGTAQLVIGCNETLQFASEAKRKNITQLENELAALYNTFPKNATAQQRADWQSKIQEKQTEIQAAKVEDDAQINQLQSTTSNEADQMANILKQSITEEQMGKALFAPIDTVANKIGSLGSPQSK